MYIRMCVLVRVCIYVIYMYVRIIRSYIRVPRVAVCRTYVMSWESLFACSRVSPRKVNCVYWPVASGKARGYAGSSADERTCLPLRYRRDAKVAVVARASGKTHEKGRSGGEASAALRNRSAIYALGRPKWYLSSMSFGTWRLADMWILIFLCI